MHTTQRACQRLAGKVGFSGDADPEAKYEDLKRQYVRLVKESKRLSDLLRALQAQEEFKDLLEELGLDMENLSNVDEVIAKLLETYQGQERTFTYS